MTITNYTADTWPLLLKSLKVLNLFLFLEITYFSITNVQKKKKKKNRKKETIDRLHHRDGRVETFLKFGSFCMQNCISGHNLKFSQN